MQHIQEAKQLYMAGDSKSALDIVESILALSPKNTEALRLKAAIFDARGQFDESLRLLQQVVNLSPVDDERAALELQNRQDEDRDSLIYSKFTEEGRWYYSFSPLQIFIAVFGLAGCILFLISSPMYFQRDDSFIFLGLSFFVLVLFPWLMLFILHFQGVKKILVGFEGISVYQGFSKLSAKWDEIERAILEYDHDLNENYLHLILYSNKTHEILFDFNVSHKKSDVFARRHFVRSILNSVEHTSHTDRGKRFIKVDDEVYAEFLQKQDS